MSRSIMSIHHMKYFHSATDTKLLFRSIQIHHKSINGFLSASLYQLAITLIYLSSSIDDI